MIFVDSNIFVYAVGRAHPLRAEAQKFFLSSLQENRVLVTSAEVLQELMHVYLPVRRMDTLDAALDLAVQRMDRILPIDAETVVQARQLVEDHPALTARDLLHLALCSLHQIHDMMTFDRNLQAAFRRTR